MRLNKRARSVPRARIFPRRNSRAGWRHTIERARGCCTVAVIHGPPPRTPRDGRAWPSTNSNAPRRLPTRSVVVIEAGVFAVELSCRSLSMLQQPEQPPRSTHSRPRFPDPKPPADRSHHPKQMTREHTHPTGRDCPTERRPGGFEPIAQIGSITSRRRSTQSTTGRISEPRLVGRRRVRRSQSPNTHRPSLCGLGPGSGREKGRCGPATHLLLRRH